MARNAFARLKAEAAPPAPVTPPPAVVEARKQASRVGKKTVIFYDNPEVVRTLKHLATDKDTTIQALMQEAVDLLLIAHGKHAFGKR